MLLVKAGASPLCTHRTPTALLPQHSPSRVCLPLFVDDPKSRTESSLSVSFVSSFPLLCNLVIYNNKNLLVCPFVC